MLVAYPFSSVSLAKNSVSEELFDPLVPDRSYVFVAGNLGWSYSWTGVGQGRALSMIAPGRGEGRRGTNTGSYAVGPKPSLMAWCRVDHVRDRQGPLSSLYLGEARTCGALKKRGGKWVTSG